MVNGSDVYENEDFLSNYMKRRSRKESPNNAIEGPIIFDLLGDYKNKIILDLGCGDASFGKELLTTGAKSFVGVEGSKQMVQFAQNLQLGENAEIVNKTMESYQYPTDYFDIVTSRFSIHYVDNIEVLFQNIYRSLQENGKFVFSIQHPITTSSFASKEKGDKRGNWVVDDYFVSGERKEPWIDKVVVKYHRTIEQYFQALTQAGFTVESLREGMPKRENFSSDEEYQRRMRIPLLLVFSCVK